MKFTVIGAGMAGLLAGAILREQCELILEAQTILPNNHSALLRFRSPIVGDTLNIPFRKVAVMKAVANSINPVADAISYSLKTNGKAQLRSITEAHGKLEERWIAPPDLVARMAGKVVGKIIYGANWDKPHGDPIISTLPMPTLMRLLGYTTELTFESVIGFALTARLRDTDLCATIYFPDSADLAYRASITGDRLIVEYAFPGASEADARENMKHINDYPLSKREHLREVLAHFAMNTDHIAGVPEVKLQRYAKILPVSDEGRKRFMLWATEQHNVYSLGRFATWRPGLLMDDLVNDMNVIQRLAGGGTSYDARRRYTDS
jgi:hypothetical protein